MTSDQLLAKRERSAPRSRRESHRRGERFAPVRGTERKLATVMFVDVKGSMGLSAAIDAEEWWTVLAGLYEVMCEAVDRHGGWIGNFTGDGIKGIFEAPDAADLHARRACRAALWLRQALVRPGAQLMRDHGLELAVRIGIHSGEVLTGTIGDRYSRHYTASGYAVAMAKRIEGLARPGRVYMTEDTAALVADRVQLRDLGTFRVKGAQAPVGVFELLEA